MSAWLDRVVLRWLRVVAPPDWIDSVLGDLREERGYTTQRRGGVTESLHLARIASRFTLDAFVRWWQERRGGIMTAFVSDVRQAVRTLGRSPGFSLIAVLTLAIAIGANTAIYSALSSLVLQPLPFPQGDRYVFIWHKNPDMGGIMLTPPLAAIDRWRGATHIFDAIESYSSRTVIVTDGGEPEEMPLTRLRPTALSTLGVSPILGRPIQPADLAPDAPPVLLISHAFWTNRLGRDSAIVGRPVRLGETTYTVIGVMPSRFALPMGGDTLWTAAKTDARENAGESENTLARLAPGVTVEQAQAALDAFGDPGGEHKGWTGQIMTPADSNGTQIKTALFVLMGAVGLLLLIACVNVANLLLSRHSSRRREIAMRHALGASRWRLTRLLFVESAIVAAAGGLAGAGIASVGLDAISAMRPRNLDVLERIELDTTAIAFAAAVSALTAILCGLAPAISASRARLHDVIAAGGRPATAATQGVRRLLTAAQVAGALVLLVGATLLLRSYSHLTDLNPGYDPANVLAVRVSLPSDRYPSTRRQVFFDDTLTAVRSIPGVADAAVGSGVPPESGVTFGTLEIEGRPAESPRTTLFSGGYVTPTYFATLRIPVLDGRVFADDDAAGRDRVVVLGASFVRQYFPAENPIGRRIRLQSDGPWSTVIGVVADVRTSTQPADSGRPQLYYARAQLRPGFGAIVVRGQGDPLALVPAIKTAIWAIDPTLPIDVATAEQVLARSISQQRFNMALLACFAACGLLLAVVGVYGVTALYVGQRHREVGIRMALGATRGAVAALVGRQTAIVVGIGVVLGVTGAAWLSRFLRELVFQIPTTDLISYAAPAMAVVLSAVAATVIPLRRATRIDPAVVLRTD